MKIKLEQEDIQAIVKEVIEGIKPLFYGNGKSQGEDTIYDVEGLADYLRVGKQWVYQRVHHNDIPHLKVGKYPRFRKSQIDEWLELTGRKRQKG